MLGDKFLIVKREREKAPGGEPFRGVVLIRENSASLHRRVQLVGERLVGDTRGRDRGG